MRFPKYSLIIIVLIALIGVGWLIKNNKTRQNTIVIQDKEEFDNQQARIDEIVNYEVESYVENLFVPWEIVFTSPNRILVTERNGKIRVIENGTLRSQPLINFPEVSTISEEGLMGLVLDPQYESNKLIYTCYAYAEGQDLFDKVVVLKDNETYIEAQNTIIDRIPAAQFHAGCRLGFGPDLKLYITTGDATQKELAQDVNSLAGKILRINPDGTIPEDNPFPNSPIYSYGHRNPQGIDWHPVSEIFVSTEHGPSIIDGPPGGDEVNIIKKGQNYGWPLVSHEKNKEGLIGPKIIFTPAVAPASGTFYSGVVFPQFKNHFLFGGLKGEGIFRVVFAENTPETIVAYEKLSGINVGRIRAITEGPDGFIYFSTSNRDGKSETRDGDDRIYMLVPVK